MMSAWRWRTCPSSILPTLLLLLSLLCLYLPACVRASRGDISKIHQNILRSCLNLNCSTDEKLERFYQSQPRPLKLLGWDCTHECRYQTMWLTVQYYLEMGKPVPQFYGKWPFIRVFGIQEPASVLFSIGNGLAQVYFIFELRKHVPNTVPMYYVGFFQGLVAINAWIWSTVFHTRDLVWTEMLDYYCAYSIVLFALITALIRIFAVNVTSVNRRLIVVIVIVTTFVYFRHIYYLTFINFDYGYNMKVNVGTGILNFVLLICWSIWNIRIQPYLWKAIASVVSINLCLLLEVLDFPPVFWMLDAHSLWHASTIPIAFLWTSFFIDDCLYLHSGRVQFKKGV